MKTFSDIAQRLRDMADRVEKIPTTIRAATIEIDLDRYGPSDMAQWPAFLNAVRKYVADLGPQDPPENERIAVAERSLASFGLSTRLAPQLVQGYAAAVEANVSRLVGRILS
ncbi:hypothetical protein [Methylobacterium terrae]|uniref:hypothetical protein n=1 Tax=Methylobacterium terrae TaxID=2202827 RepID=UPI0013A57E83|nr:hypothetical protein [Methylobacterium terrae]